MLLPTPLHPATPTHPLHTSLLLTFFPSPSSLSAECIPGEQYCGESKQTQMINMTEGDGGGGARQGRGGESKGEGEERPNYTQTY